jgi:hypothetical protein
MAEGPGVCSQQLRSTTPTGRRFQREAIVALFRGEQRPLLFGVARLTASLAFR